MSLIDEMNDDVVSCREARTNDLESILDIDRNVYDGMDYVQHYYEHYMENPNYHCFVGEIRQQVVAFMYMYAIDDAQSIVTGANRVKAEYRHRRISCKLSTFATNVMASLHPTARFIYTAYDTEYHRKLVTNHPDFFRILSKRRLWGYKTTVGQIKKLVKSDNFQQRLCRDDYHSKQTIKLHQYVGKDEAVRLLITSSDEVKRSLFPDNLLIAVWEPYKILESNIRYVADICTIRATTNDTTTECVAVSISSSIPCKVGLRYDVEFYGLEQGEAERHLLAGLTDVVKTDAETDRDESKAFMMTLYYPDNMPPDCLHGLAKAFGWEQGPWSTKYSHYLTMEKMNPVEWNRLQLEAHKKN